MKLDKNRRNLFSPGSVIDERYVVQSTLGIGRSGVVIAVQDRLLDGEQLALKLVQEQLVLDEVILKRFTDEALIARQLSHPNIVRTFF